MSSRSGLNWVRLFRRGLARGGAALLILWLLSLPLQAHGGGTARLTNAEVGPYRLFAWTTPEPLVSGDMHLTLSVILPPPDESAIDENVLSNVLDTAVIDAVVNVTLQRTGQPESAISEQAVVASTLGSLYYEVDTEIVEAGEWQVVVDVQGPKGGGTANFAVEIAREGIVSSSLLITGGIVLVGLILLSVGWSRAQKTRSTRRRRPARASAG